MRIAYLVNQYPMVSHTFIRREISALERHGFEVVRFALRGWNDVSIDHNDDIERARTRYVIRAGVTRLLVATLFMLRWPLRLVKAVGLAWRMSRQAERPLPVHLVYLAEACCIGQWARASKVQHLHAHFGTNSAEVAMLVNILTGIPWSFTVHGPEEFDKAPLIGLPEKIRSCSFVVAISSFGRSQLFRLVEKSHWPKVHVVHCGLDRDYFERPRQPPSEPRRLVCVGRLCKEKGQLLLLDAMRLLAAEGISFELVLVGDGELRKEIEALLEQYELSDYVRITGWIDGSNVMKEIMAAQALVLPSFAEGLPVALIEAMALRRPVISTYIAGIPELVMPGENGWLVPAGDVESLVDAMRSCLHSPPTTLERMGDAAHQRALVYHDVNIEAVKLATLIHRAVEVSRPK